jgi:hypothetical protein
MTGNRQKVFNQGKGCNIENASLKMTVKYILAVLNLMTGNRHKVFNQGKGF